MRRGKDPPGSQKTRCKGPEVGRAWWVPGSEQKPGAFMDGARKEEGEVVGGRRGPDYRGPRGLGLNFVLRTMGKSLPELKQGSIVTWLTF